MKNKRFLQTKLSRLNAVVWMVVLTLLVPAHKSMAQVTANDSTALVALYNGTAGANWFSATNWLTGPVGTWQGVTIANKRVTEVYLPFNNLSGVLHDEVKKLTELKFLGLPGNQLSGAIPSSLSNLKKLTALDLSENKFTGSIPASLTLLTKLTSLNLSRNTLSGKIPATIGLLYKLTYLNLAQNSLTGNIPVNIALMADLKDLFLENNQLSGNIPSVIGFLEKAEQVYLYGNKLCGSIPSSIGSMDSLVYFNVSSNQLTGAVPSSVASLTRLYLFNIESNQIADLPNLSGVSSLFQLIVGNNRLTFADLEPNITKMLPGSYAPQDSVGTNKTVTVCEGDSLVLSADVLESSPNNTFVWFKTDYSYISDASSSPVLVLPNATAADAGIYSTEITNSHVPDLYLYRKAVFVTVNTCPVTEATARNGATKVFPAPFEYEATVEVTTAKDENLTLVLIDKSGQVVTQLANLKTNERISIGASLPRGLYYLKSQHGGRNEVVRIIKK
jgi:Leucine-rich repeat (LRR) protein